MLLVYSDPKTGKTNQIELDQAKAAMLMNHKINEIVDGSMVGLQGCKIKITGGSDTSGFAMHRSIPGTAKKRALLRASKTARGRLMGQFKRVTVRGNTITAETQQVNSVIVEHEGSIDGLFKQKQAEQKGEEPKEEKA